MDVQACLADRHRYERQIERLHQRHLLSSRLYELRQDDVSLATVIINRGKVGRLLARDVSRGRYQLEPGELRTIKVRNKLREVFACRMTDLIVHGVVADIVAEASAQRVSDRVFSYRKGMASMTPVAEFAAYLRAHRRSRPDPRERGVYVLRRDVRKYFDSIPIGRDSPLWPMLEAELGAPLHPLVESVIRAEMRLAEGGLATRIRGLPTGQPVSSVLANLYLSDMDRAVEDTPGGFYARYGDDFLFAHPDPAVTAAADAAMASHLHRLSPTVNAEKNRTVFLTPAGRPSAEWPSAQGAPAVPFLGSRIAADGTVGLDPPKVRGLLREIDRRTAATVATLRGADRVQVGRTVCTVVNAALDPHTALTQHRSALLLRRVVTDRTQLAQLDHQIARIVAQALTGRAGAQAFRRWPPRALRRELGLVSLVAARNGRRSAA